MKREPTDQIEIKILLTQEQCDALADEAKAKGLKFFDHCRDKLMERITTPARTSTPRQAASYGRSPIVEMLPELQQDNRITRLEAMMADMQYLLKGMAEHAMKLPPHAIEEPVEQPAADIDVNDVISNAMREAERQGLTAIEREAPQEQTGVRHVGTRPPSRFSVTPRHLQGVLPG